MLTRSLYLQRQLAALLVTASGLWQISGLWLQRLSDPVLLSALTGAAYLLTGIGLFGQSRFSLFVGIVLPGGMLGLVASEVAVWSPALILRATADLLIILLCARVLWALRHQPSL